MAEDIGCTIQEKSDCFLWMRTDPPYFNACLKSAIKSSTASTPTDNRINPSLIPSDARIAGGSEA